MLEYLVYKMAMTISLYTPLRFAYWVALRVADFHYLFDRKAREAVKKNLRQVLGPERSERMVGYEARWTFRQFGKYLAEFFRFARFGARFVEKHVLTSGAENVKEALKEGRGAIVLSAHLGNWELGASVFVDLGCRVSVVVLDHKNPRVNVLLNKQRTNRGVEVLPAGGYLRGCYRALKDGKLVALLGDRDVTGTGVRMEFLGKEVTLPHGPARLSVRTGAPILPVFMVRRSNDSWHTYIEKPIYPDTSLDREEAVQRSMKEYIPIMERFIRWHPSQWAIFYDFWGAEDQ